MSSEETTRLGDDDVVDLLVSQHVAIKDLFARTLAANGDDRLTLFHELCHRITTHEVSEEAIVHPAATRAFPGGDEIVSKSLVEENDTKKTLAHLEKLNHDSLEFEATLCALERAVHAHAKREEQEELVPLRGAISHDRLVKMQRAVKLYEARSPTHPRPGKEPSATMAGPLDHLVDRARDAGTSKA